MSLYQRLLAPKPKPPARKPVALLFEKAPPASANAYDPVWLSLSGRPPLAPALELERCATVIQARSRGVMARQQLERQFEADDSPRRTASAADAPAATMDEPSFTEAEIAALRTSTPFAEWGELHERGLAYMRQQRDAALRTNASLAPSAEMASDLRMWRFLVATSFRAAEAAKMYADALAWRAERRIDAMRDALVEANPAFFGGGAAGLQMPHIHAVDTLMMKARPRTWYRAHQEEAAGGEKGSAVTRYEPLLDKGGNLVYIEVPSAFDAAAMCEMEDEYLDAEFRAHELLQLVIDELSRRQGRMCLIFRVLDLHGFSLTGSLFASAEVKQGEALVKQVGKEVKDAYPTTTFKHFLINAPAASFAGPLVAALVPKRSRDKTVIKGADYAPELHKWVDPANLPRKLGGTLDDGLQWTGMKSFKNQVLDC